MWGEVLFIGKSGLGDWTSQLGSQLGLGEGVWVLTGLEREWIRVQN